MAISSDTSASAPPKSILKPPKAYPFIPSSPPLSSTSKPNLPIAKTPDQKRALASAITHAQRLQDEKAVILLNIDAIDELSTYPLPDTPLSECGFRFLELVNLFHSSDYDALVEERNALSKCGYVLCANPPRKELGSPISNTKKGHTFGRSAWCSSACAEKALYVMAQLDETPAWERQNMSERTTLKLKPERSDEGQIQVQSQSQGQSIQLPVRSTKHTTPEAQTVLASERGDKPTSHIPKSVLSAVVEKTSRKPATAPTQTGNYDAVEGYRVSRTVYNLDTNKR